MILQGVGKLQLDVAKETEVDPRVVVGLRGRVSQTAVFADGLELFSLKWYVSLMDGYFSWKTYQSNRICEMSWYMIFSFSLCFFSLHLPCTSCTNSSRRLCLCGTCWLYFMNLQTASWLSWLNLADSWQHLSFSCWKIWNGGELRA